MANCKRCNQEMDENINYCPTCGEDQRANDGIEQKGNASFLIVLCVLTLIGSIFTIGRAYLYEMVSMMGGNSNYIRGWIYAGSGIGTLVGAVMMLQRKLKGLHIYSLFQLIYIITVLVASSSYNKTFDKIGGGNADTLLASGIAMFFVLPSILFLVLYWTNMVKKHLR